MQATPNGGSMDPAQRAVVERSEDLRSAIKELAALPTSRSGPMPYGPNGPICTHEHGAYSVQYQTVTFDFNYVSPDRDGGVWAEMEVIHTAPSLISSILRARVNLLRGTSRREAVRELTSRYAAISANWAEMLEQATYWVVERFRTGEPGVLLQEVPQPEAADWLLPTMALTSLPTIWFGDAGVGKSMLALAAAASIASGKDILAAQPSTRMNVAFLDWEFEPWQHRSRLDRIWPNADPLNIYYYRCHSSLADQVDRFRAEFRRNKIDYLILDSAAMACGGEPEKADSALTFFNALNSFELGSLIIAHTTKNGSDDKPFGSRFWDASSRCTWLVKAQQEPGRGNFELAMFNKKCNVDRLAKPRGYKVSFDDGAIRFSTADVVRELTSDLSVGVRLLDRIMACIEREPKTYLEIGEMLGTSMETVRKTIARDEGRFTKLHNFEDRVMRIGLRARAPE